MKAVAAQVAAACALSLWMSIAAAAELTAAVVDADGKPLVDAVVYVTGKNAVASGTPRNARLDQVNKTFVPRISVIQTGTPVEFPNSDDIRHQVYSFSPAKVFTLKLYAGKPSQPVIFDKPGVVVLGCNIHDTMVAWVLVVDTPWFAKTDAQGHAVIKDLPPGSYELQAWHPGVTAPVASGALELKGSEKVDRAITLHPNAVPGLTGP
jgi:plastocyanin